MLVWSGADARSQGLVVGGGLGPTAVLDHHDPGHGHGMGFVEFEMPRGLGFRLEGNETVSALLLTADVTLSTTQERRLVRTYLVLGGGVAADASDADPEINGGAGLALPLVPELLLFIEARLHRLLGSDRPSRTLLPITFGLRLGLL
jgi:hypothetical protein